MKGKKEYFRALTIGGSDNSGGAGIQADLKTFSALECYGMSVITALTAQNTQGVRSIQEVKPEFVEEQFNVILEDIGVDAIKIGMLFNVPIIKVIAKCLYKVNGYPIVLDPVMFAKSGDRLLQEEAVKAIQKELFPLATVVTPNIPEAQEFLGYSIENSESMRQAAMDLCDSGPAAVVIKGGGLSDDFSDDCLFVKGGELLWFKQERISTNNIHGTGCTFSSAIAAYLARSYKLEDAVREAKLYLTQSLKAGADKKLGKGQGPVLHFFNTWEK